MKQIQLSTDQLRNLAEKRLDELKRLKAQLQRNLKSSLQGRLRLGKSNGCVQYFHVTSDDEPRGSFIAKRERSLAACLAQKDYENLLLSNVQKMMSSLQTFLKKYTPENVDLLYDQLHPGRRCLFQPIIPTQEMFVEHWLSELYEGLPFENDSPELQLPDDGCVRSKSEAIITGTLDRLNIPYRYEFPLHLKNNVCIHPDFICLNVRTRKEIVWEHFGMLDKLDYVNNFVLKMRTYSKNGYVLGSNLIFTVENKDIPLSPNVVENLARTHLL